MVRSGGWTDIYNNAVTWVRVSGLKTKWMMSWITRKVMQEMLCLSQVSCGNRVCSWMKARVLKKESETRRKFWQEEAGYAKIWTRTFYSGNHSELTEWISRYCRLRVWQRPFSWKAFKSLFRFDLIVDRESLNHLRRQSKTYTTGLAHGRNSRCGGSVLFQGLFRDGRHCEMCAL